MGGMRVAHFIQRYPPALGGSEAYFARLSRFLAGEGHGVSVFTSSAVSLEAFWSKKGQCLEVENRQEDGVEIQRFGLVRFPGRRFLLKALSLWPHPFWQCLTQPCNPICPGMWRHAGRIEGFDLVHASAFPYTWPIVCGLRLARRLHVPFFLTPFLHLGDPDNPGDPTRQQYTQHALAWLLKQANRVFVQTEWEKAEACKMGVAPERVVLQGLGVDFHDCTGGDRDKVRRDWNIQARESVIGHLANQSREKGTTDLLSAAAILWQRGVPIRLVLAGPEMPNFQKFWRTFSWRHPEECQQNVVRLGILTDGQKKDFFSGLDVFALPSRSDSFGLVLLEAWANGIPNAAYRAGGIAEIIRHQEDGLLVRCGDVEGLAGSLEKLAREESLRQKLGQAGRERCLGEFRWEDKLKLVHDCMRKDARTK